MHTFQISISLSDTNRLGCRQDKFAFHSDTNRWIQARQLLYTHSTQQVHAYTSESTRKHRHRKGKCAKVCTSTAYSEPRSRCTTRITGAFVKGRRDARWSVAIQHSRPAPALFRVHSPSLVLKLAQRAHLCSTLSNLYHMRMTLHCGGECTATSMGASTTLHARYSSFCR